MTNLEKGNYINYKKMYENLRSFGHDSTDPSPTARRSSTHIWTTPTDKTLSEAHHT